MTFMPLDLVEQLPQEIAPEEVTHHVPVGHAPGGLFGETHLLAHRGRLLAFWRGSMLTPYRQIPVSEGLAPRLERGSFSSTLWLSTAAGQESVELSMFEVDAAAELLRALFPQAFPTEHDDGESASKAPEPPEPPAAEPEPSELPAAEPEPAMPPPVPEPAMPPPVPTRPAPPPVPNSTEGQPPDSAESSSASERRDREAEAALLERRLQEDPHDIVTSLSLEEIYRDTGDDLRLARLLSARVDILESPVEQVETLWEVAHIHASSGDPEQGLKTLMLAYLMDYTNRATVFRMEQLADEHGLWNLLLSELNDLVQRVDEISTRAGILVQMSRWYRRVYSRTDYADACLMHAKRLDPQHPAVLAALGELAY